MVGCLVVFEFQNWRSRSSLGVSSSLSSLQLTFASISLFLCPVLETSLQCSKYKTIKWKTAVTPCRTLCIKKRFKSTNVWVQFLGPGHCNCRQRPTSDQYIYKHSKFCLTQKVPRWTTGKLKLSRERTMKDWQVHFGTAWVLKAKIRGLNHKDMDGRQAKWTALTILSPQTLQSMLDDSLICGSIG